MFAEGHKGHSNFKLSRRYSFRFKTPIRLQTICLESIKTYNEHDKNKRKRVSMGNSHGGTDLAFISKTPPSWYIVRKVSGLNCWPIGVLWGLGSVIQMSVPPAREDLPCIVSQQDHIKSRVPHNLVATFRPVVRSILPTSVFSLHLLTTTSA